MTLEIVNGIGHTRPGVAKKGPTGKPMRPLETGQTAPFFAIIGSAAGWQTSVFTVGMPGQVWTLSELLREGPLVIGFYCPWWGSYAEPYLAALSRLSASIRNAGSQLLVLSNVPSRYALHLLGRTSIHLIHDMDHAVAQRFGIVSQIDPLLNRVASTAGEAYVPALYVIEPSQQIRYHFRDENFERSIDQDRLLDALQP